jgi:SagB-type dehydrogenase family enzyme
MVRSARNMYSSVPTEDDLVSTDQVLPLNLPEQNSADDDITEIFHENTKFYRSTLLPQVLNIISYLNKPLLLGRAARGFFTNILLPRVALSDGIRAAKEFSDLLGTRRSVKSFAGADISMEQIGSILHCAMRVNRVEHASNIAAGHLRPYPSAGALYPTECYVVGLHVQDYRPFIAHYDQRAHEFEMLEERFDVGRFKRALSKPSEAEGVAAAIVLTSVFARSTAKYGPRGYRFALLEAGHATQNLCLAALTHELGTRVIGGYFDDEVNALCGADGVLESVVTCLFLGHPKTGDDDDR